MSFAESYFTEGSDDGEIAKVRFNICQRLWDMTKSDTEVSMKLPQQFSSGRPLFPYYCDGSVAAGMMCLFSFEYKILQQFVSVAWYLRLLLAVRILLLIGIYGQ